MKKRNRFSMLLALAVAGLWSAPGLLWSYGLIGGNLGIGISGNGYQRDLRVFNNAADAAANNNTVPEANHPGALGAPLAVWKAAEAWNSNNPDAGKNFDFDWQGDGVNSNGSDANKVLWGTSGCGGGTLAYTETPISNGWRILMCEGWTWSDGPGTPSGGQEDITGVAAHELGHALGLGHTQNANCSGACSTNSTMCPFICNNGVSERTIEPDDAAGLAAIYGEIPSNKPSITSIGGSTFPGGTLLINGSNFASTVNVKFTAGTSTNTGTIPGVVYGVTSISSTQIAVTVPGDALDGNVLVWEPAISRLSNPFPIDIASVVCQTDLGFQGPGGGDFSICGQSLDAGNTATLLLSNAAPNALAYLVISATNSPTPFEGGMLVPVPIDALFLFGTDAGGQFTAPLAGGGGPLTIYAQFVTFSGGSYGLSNALEIVFGP